MECACSPPSSDHCLCKYTSCKGHTCVGSHACLCSSTTVMLASAQGDPSWGGLQVPQDPISKLPGLLEALKLMDAAVQQNNYHEKLLMYRNVRIPQHDKVNDSRHLCGHMCMSTCLQNTKPIGSTASSLDAMSAFGYRALAQSAHFELAWHTGRRACASTSQEG